MMMILPAMSLMGIEVFMLPVAQEHFYRDPREEGGPVNF